MKKTGSGFTPLKLFILIAAAIVLLAAGFLAGRILNAPDPDSDGQQPPAAQSSTPDSAVSAPPGFEFEPEQVNPGLNAVIGTDTQDSKPANDPDPAPQKSIEIPGYGIIPVTAGSTQLTIDLFNPDRNEVYFQIGFFLTDTGEKLFETKLIRPGQHLYTVEMSRGLEAGDHPVTIQYSTFSTDGSFTPRNGATLNCIMRAG